MSMVFEQFYMHYKEIMYFVFENTIYCHGIAFNCSMQCYYKTENMVQEKLNMLI